jgi:geranylgeranyl diphosphate synthase type I
VLNTLAQRYFADIDSEMRQVVALTPTAGGFDTLIQYPLGWVDEAGKPYDNPTGKRIRPLVLLLCTEAAGGKWRDALPAAAAVELLHNFTLLHDDIQDNSPIRHGRPTVWKVWGSANAINAGDALFTLSYCALNRLEDTTPAKTLLRIWRVFNETMLDLTRGQHLDMRFETQKAVTTDEYISMIRGKTAALLAACAQIGALVGSRNEEKAQHFADFGLNLGIAFQIHDDILGIWGDPKVTGKSAATDILAKKKSLPVLFGLERSPALNEVYSRPRFKRADVNEAIALLDSVGTRDYTTQLENDYYRRALESLDAAQPQGEAGEQLRALAAWLFQRAF